jgi:PTH1 family peptidyl-tRNA hydrolase
MNRLAELFASIKTSSPAPKGPLTHIIVGLGNPGKQYENTRHNVGFQAIDQLAADHKIDIRSSRFQALVGEGMIGETHVLLMKPQTYMNLSGDAVKAAADYYHIAPEHILVYCDDISFDVGQMRIRRKGSAGGHNGLKSMISRLGGDNFPRVKIGVGQKPHPDYDLADWVLSNLPKEAQDKMKAVYQNISRATLLLLEDKFEEAMNQFSR